MLLMRLPAMALAATMLCTAPLAAQSTVYTTFGPGDSYDLGLGYTIGGGPDQWIAAPFTYAGPNGDLLHALRFATAAVDVSPAGITVSFWGGSSTAPTTLLESWTGIAASAEPSIFTLSSVMQPSLADGSIYWLMFSTPPANHFSLKRSTVETGPVATSYDMGGTWDLSTVARPAFDVSTIPGTPGEVVPEPATMTLLATGLLGLGAARRKKRQQR